VFGEVPLSEINTLTHGFSKKAVMATDIADLVGAAFVIGEPENIEMLRRQSLPVSQKRQQDFQAAEDRGEHRLAMWLRQGERGASSNAMSKRLFGLPQDAHGFSRGRFKQEKMRIEKLRNLTYIGTSL
jgi:hypothetical protein